MVFLIAFGLAAWAAPEKPAKKSVLSPEKAGRAEGAAAEYSRKAVICDWLATQHKSGELTDVYTNLSEIYRAAAEQKWRVWQACHFDNDALLKQAESDCRALTRQVGNLEKRLKPLNAPRPDEKVFDSAAGELGTERAGQAAGHERAAIQCECQAHIHNYQSEKRREDYQRYNLAMSETYTMLAEQHWHAWRACRLNDIEVIVKAQANVRILRGRLEGYRRERDDYKDAVRSAIPAETAANNEAIAVNHGMRAVKCGQIAVQVDGDLKQIYLELADNFRKSSKIHRDMANAAATRNVNAMTALEIKILTMRDERQALWDREKTLLPDMQHDPDKMDQRRKIAEFKHEYQSLCAQIAQIKLETK